MPSPYQYREFGIFRLLLAICVLVQHAIVNAAPAGRLRAVLAPCEIGSMAVLVFFCLSGFVITEAASSSLCGQTSRLSDEPAAEDLPAFRRRRPRRNLPACAVFLAGQSALI